MIAYQLYLTYDKLTGTITSIPSAHRHPSCMRGKLDAHLVEIDGVVFAGITINGVLHRISAGRLAHYLHLGILPDREPIYINGLASDLRWCNMRFRPIGFVSGHQNPTQAKISTLQQGQTVFAAHDPA